MIFRNSYQYLEKYDKLKNGFYEYQINDAKHSLYTIFENRSGWIKVVDVNWNNNLHLNENSVNDVKISDDSINLLRTNHFDYNVMASAENFKSPMNDWLRYPNNIYIHKSMEYFSSITPAMNINNSNYVSLELSKSPMKIYQLEQDIGFGSGSCGDTFFSFGSKNYNGFYQNFSGPGKGSVFVR